MNGSTVALKVKGITALEVSNATISTNQSPAQTTLSLTVMGQYQTNNPNTITIPKTAVNHGLTPKIYVNNQEALDQGFSQDTTSYYVWYKTIFKYYELSIVFAAKPSATGFPIPVALSVILVIVIAVATVFLRGRRIGLLSKKSLIIKEFLKGAFPNWQNGLKVPLQTSRNPTKRKKPLRVSKASKVEKKIKNVQHH